MMSYVDRRREIIFVEQSVLFLNGRSQQLNKK